MKVDQDFLFVEQGVLDVTEKRGGLARAEHRESVGKKQVR